MFKIIIALESEAKPFIEYFKLKKIASSPFSLYQNQDLTLAVSGVGSLNASACVMHLHYIKSKNEHWINLGVAGHSTHALGNLFSVCRVSHPQIKKCFYPYSSIKINTPRAALKSLDSPSQDYLGDMLYDMEGYGFTFAAAKISSLDRIHLFKIISDNSKTPLHSITKDDVSQYVADQLPWVEMYLDLLRQDLEASTEDITIPPSFPIHFSETQRHQLKRLLGILQLHRPGQYSLSSLQKWGSSKNILLYLEKEIFELPLS